MADYKFNNLVGIKYAAMEILGDELRDEIVNLEEDIEFFNMYMARNKKSKMGLYINVVAPGTKTILNDLITAICGMPNAIRPMFSGKVDYIYPLAVYHIYSIMVNHIYSRKDSDVPIPDDQIRTFMNTFSEETGLDPLAYVGEVINHSGGVDEVKNELKRIIENT